MELDFEKIKFLDSYLIPHIALTTFKYRAKATALLKQLNAKLTIDQLIILRVLSYLENLTQQELADILYKDKSNLSRMIETLVKKGLISSSLDLKDKHAVKRLNITQEGLDYIEQFFHFAVNLQKHTLEGISQEEIDTVKNVMKKIRTNLNKNIEVEL